MSERYVIVYLETGEVDKRNKILHHQRVSSLENSRIIESVPVFGILSENSNDITVTNVRAIYHLPKDIKSGGYFLRDISEEEYYDLESSDNLEERLKELLKS